MRVAKYYEFVCDNCNCGNHPPGNNIKDCIYQAKALGSVFKGGKYFCNQECYEQYKSNKKRKN